ncbi:MAG: NTP transferase domain-containing protein [Polyangiales bacterium]
MTSNYRAVILAAGRGSRLASHTREVPKALLPIGPRSRSDDTPTCFLRRQVELLHDNGVSEVIVVVGCLKEQIIAAAGRWQLRTPLSFVVNDTPDMGTSGSLHSFQYAVRSSHNVLDGRRQTLLMDADIVYHHRALETFLSAPARSSLLVSPNHRGDDEEVLVYGTVEQPRFLGKGLTPELVSGQQCLGEAVGIVKFAPEDHALARASLDWMLGDPSAPEGTGRHRGFGPARRATEHEELTQRFMRYRKMQSVVLDPALPFMECDDAAEYERLRTVFYPRLLEQEAASGSAGGTR